jgi:hypothetical protein
MLGAGTKAIAFFHFLALWGAKSLQKGSAARVWCAAPRQIDFTAKSPICKGLPPQAYDKLDFYLFSSSAGEATLF